MGRAQTQTFAYDDLYRLTSAQASSGTDGNYGPDLSSAQIYLRKTIEKYQKTASQPAIWLEANLSEGLTVFSFPAAH
jgi:hypothetical protein